MDRSTKGKNWSAITAAAAALALAGVFSGAARAADDPAGVKLFAEKIRPILATSCVGCHGEEKQKAGLRLDTRDYLLKGAKDEDKLIKVIEPGDPDKSKIIASINYKDEDTAMPPPKKNKETGNMEDRKLPDDQIKAFTEWVKLGAPWDGGGPVVAVKK
jgi:mono/diheme cytochrome c family protein